MNQQPQRPQRPQRPDVQQQPMGQQPIMQQPMTQQQKIADMQQKSKKKTLKVVLIILAVIVGLAGIGVGYYFLATARFSSRVIELEETVNNLNLVIESKDERIKTLNQAVSDTTVKEVIPITSLQRIEGSDVPEFWLQDGDFVAPNMLQIPNTSDGVNDSFCQVGSKFVIRPSDRWIMNVQGATYEFSHPQHIWGKMRALMNKEGVPTTDMQALIQNFFVGYPSTTITYRKVFLSDKVVGMMGKAQVTVYYYEDEQGELVNSIGVEPTVKAPNTIETQIVDGVETQVEVPSTEQIPAVIKQKKDMVINVGFYQYSDYSMTFLFIYDAETGNTGQELIDLLLRSTSAGVNGDYIKLE